jgi:hypothetical protein
VAGAGGGGGANRVDAKLLSQLVQPLAVQGVLGARLGHGRDFIWS